MDIERKAQVNFDVQVTLEAMRIHQESRNNNDNTIMYGVVRPRAYCSIAHAI